MSITWYRTGTVTLTNGSAIAVGDGTAWLSNAKAGDMFIAAVDGKVYEVLSVGTNTELTLQSEFTGVTGAALLYATIPLPSSVSNSELALQLAALVGRWNVREDQMINWLGSLGSVTITDSGGQDHVVLTPQQLALDYDTIAAADFNVLNAAASTSADEALASANSATQSANQTTADLAAIVILKDSAAASESEAITYAGLAEQSKNNADAAVDSADNHKIAANTHRADAVIAKDAALVSEGNAADSATDAGLQRANCEAFKNAAGVSETNAATSEQNAAAAEASIVQSANTATDKANAATLSADAAEASANSILDTWVEKFSGSATLVQNTWGEGTFRVVTDQDIGNTINVIEGIVQQGGTMYDNGIAMHHVRRSQVGQFNVVIRSHGQVSSSLSNITKIYKWE